MTEEISVTAGTRTADEPVSEVRRALAAVVEAARAAEPIVRDRAGVLGRAEAGMAVEALADVANSSWELLASVAEEVEGTDGRFQRWEGTSSDPATHASEHLFRAIDALAIASHLMGMGRRDLLTAVRSQD